MLLEDEDDYFVPKHFPEASSKRVLATELIQGVPLDVVAEMDQETRNKVWESTNFKTFIIYCIDLAFHVSTLFGNNRSPRFSGGIPDIKALFEGAV